MLRTEFEVESTCSNVKQISKFFLPIFIRERLTKADSDLLDCATGLGYKTTSYNSVPQNLIKTENDGRTHKIVNTCDVDEIFASGKATKVSNKPEKRNVLKTPVVDMKRTTLDNSKFREAPQTLS